MAKLILLFVSMLSVVTATAKSRVLTDSIYSTVLQTWRQYTIYLPQSYDSGSKRYPILYLLHGMDDTNICWTEKGHLAEIADALTANGEMQEMVIVTPNAGGSVKDGVWNGYFNMEGWTYEEFFYTEFMPHIESTYRIVCERQHRGIAGLSMGGGGAVSYAQRHSDTFCAVYAMSALMTIPAGWWEEAASRDDKMGALTRAVMQKSTIAFVECADDEVKEQLKQVQWFVDCGDDDYLFNRNIEFVQAMHKAEIPLELRVRDGGHTWEYWRTALYTCLPFISRNIRL